MVKVLLQVHDAMLWLECLLFVSLSHMCVCVCATVLKFTIIKVIHQVMTTLPWHTASWDPEKRLMLPWLQQSNTQVMFHRRIPSVAWCIVIHLQTMHGCNAFQNSTFVSLILPVLHVCFTDFGLCIDKFVFFLNLCLF